MKFAVINKLRRNDVQCELTCLRAWINWSHWQTEASITGSDGAIADVKKHQNYRFTCKI